MSKITVDADNNYLLKNSLISNNEIYAGILSLIVIFVAKGISLFNLMYAIDDYSLALQGIDFTFFISAGRFGLVLLAKALSLIGLQIVDSFTINNFLTICSFVFAGLIVCRLWKVDSIGLKVFVITLMGIHPYTTELFTFRLLPFTLSFTYILGFLGLYLIRKKISGFVAGILLILFAISIYQTIVNILITVLLFSLIIFLIDNFEKKTSHVLKNFIKDEIFYKIIGVLSGVVLYLVVNKIVQMSLNIGATTRSELIGVSDFGNRIKQISDILNIVLYADQPAFFPHATKILILIISAFAFFGLFYRFKRMILTIRIFHVSLCILFLLLSVLSSLGVMIFLKDWWPVPRVLIAFSCFVPGIIIITYKCIDKIWIKKVVAFIVILIIFSFIGTNNNVLTDQLRVNGRDAFLINRLFTRLDLQNSAAKIKKVAIVGGSWGYQIPIKTAAGDMNISAFGASWAKETAVKEVLGVDPLPLTADDNSKIKEYCLKHPKNTNVDDVIILDDICLFRLH